MFDRQRYDVGSKLGYLKATVDIAARRDNIGAEFKELLADFVQHNKLI